MLPLRLPRGEAFHHRVHQAYHWVTQYHIGGFLIESGSAEAIRYVTDYLGRLARFPLIFAVDVGNLHQTSLDLTPFPSPLQIGAGISHEAFIAYVTALAQEFRAVGINLAFVPLLNRANVLSDGYVNPLAYHHSVEQLRLFIPETIEIFQKHGIATVLYYFPSLEKLPANPFKQLVHMDVEKPEEFWQTLFPDYRSHPQGVVLAPVLGNSEHFPLFMRKDFVHQWQQVSRFSGVVFSPRLDIPALHQYFYPWEVHQQALQAGVHCLVAPAQPRIAWQHLIDGLKDNSELAQKAHKAIDQIFRLKKWLHAHQPKQAHPYRVFKKVHHSEHYQLAERLAHNGTILLQQGADFDSLWRTVQRAIVMNTAGRGAYKGFIEALTRVFPEVVELSIHNITQYSPQTGDLVILLFPETNHMSVLLQQSEDLNELITFVEARHIPLLTVIWGLSRIEQLSAVLKLPGSILLTQDATLPTQRAVAKIVSGRLPITGQFPFPAEALPVQSLSYAGYSRALEPSMHPNLPADFPKGLAAGAVLEKGQLSSYTGNLKEQINLIPEDPTVFRFHVTGPLLLQAIENGWLDPSDPLVHYFPALKSTHGEMLIVEDAIHYHIQWDGGGSSTEINQAIQRRQWRMGHAKTPMPHFMTEHLLLQLLNLSFPEAPEALKRFYHTLLPFIEKPEIEINFSQATVRIPFWITVGITNWVLNRGWQGHQQLLSARTMEKVYTSPVMGLLEAQLLPGNITVPSAVKADRFVPGKNLWVWFNVPGEHAAAWVLQTSTTLSHSRVLATLAKKFPR